jgi:capsular polysaccharide biosynthesis protein
MRLRELLWTIWERKLVVGLVLVFCLVGATLYAISKPEKEYASSATIVFLPDPGRQTVTPSDNLSSLLSTYAVIAQSEKTLEGARAVLGHPVEGTLTATTATDSWVLALNSEASTPRAAQETVHAVTVVLTHEIRHNGIVQPRVVNPPFASSAPITSRSPVLIIAVAAVIGLIAGILFALLLENLAGAPRLQPGIPAQGENSA